MMNGPITLDVRIAPAVLMAGQETSIEVVRRQA